MGVPVPLYLQGSLLLRNSALWAPFPWTLANLVFCDSPFQILSPQNLPPSGFFFCHIVNQKLSQGSKLGWSWGSPHMFSISQRSLSFLAWRPLSYTPVLHTFIHVGVISRQRVNLVLMTPYCLLAEVWKYLLRHSFVFFLIWKSCAKNVGRK